MYVTLIHIHKPISYECSCSLLEDRQFRMDMYASLPIVVSVVG